MSLKPRASGRRTIGQRLRRFALVVVALLVGLAALGVVYQQVGQALDRRALAPPGRMVAVDGAMLHLHCTGSGGPTVILEAGAYGFAQVWAWVQPRLSERRRVCAYDRAGLGWSDDAAEHDGAAAVARLRALLVAAGEPGPYVLVGHSLGGALIRIFAERHPDDVVALGFIEPSHPDQLQRLPPEARAAHERVSRALRILPVLAHVGFMRLTNALGRLNAGLPDDDYRAARMFSSAPRHLRATHAEMSAWDATMAAARANHSLGDRPIVVISATEPLAGMSAEVFAVNQQLNAEVAALSSRGRHVPLAGSDHMSVLTARAHAERVAELIEATIAEASPGG
jgi:pimeloyl-ACP methyl ester carboxylesterase